MNRLAVEESVLDQAMPISEPTAFQEPVTAEKPALHEQTPVSHEPVDLSTWTETAGCPACHRIVPAREEVRDGYRYAKKYCPFEDKIFESLVEEANAQPQALSPHVNPPRYRPAIGTDVTQLTEADIPNVESIQNISLHLTPRCNSTCSVCYDRYMHGRQEMTMAYAKSIVRRHTNKFIYLFGGEPTVWKGLPELTAFIRERGNWPVLYTNGLKLAQPGYLRELVQAGLEGSYLTFDGFREEIYEKMRGGRHEYRLKLAALENLEREGVRTIIASTVVRGINDDQVGPLIDYAQHHPHVWDLSLRPLYLPGVDLDAGFGMWELLSTDEINDLVIQHVGFDRAYYTWWYEARLACVAWAKALYPKAGLNQPYPDQMYFRRDGTVLKPLLDLDVLIRLTQALRVRRWADPIFRHPTVLRLFGIVLRGRFRQCDIERRLGRDALGIVRVTQGMSRLQEDTVSSRFIVGLTYSGKGIMPAYSPA